MNNSKKETFSTSAEDHVDNTDKHVETTLAEKTEKLGYSALSRLKEELTSEFAIKLGKSMDDIKAAGTDLDNLCNQANEELATLLTIKQDKLTEKYGEENSADIEKIIAELKVNLKSDVDKLKLSIDVGENAFKAGQHGVAMAEGLEEMQKASSDAKFEAQDAKRANYLVSNGIAVDSFDSFQLNEEYAKVRREIRDIKKDLEAKRVKFTSREIMSHPKGELAAMRELSEKHKEPEQPVKQTIGQRIRGLFNRA